MAIQGEKLNASGLDFSFSRAALMADAFALPACHDAPKSKKFIFKLYLYFSFTISRNDPFENMWMQLIYHMDHH